MKSCTGIFYRTDRIVRCCTTIFLIIFTSLSLPRSPPLQSIRLLRSCECALCVKYFDFAYFCARNVLNSGHSLRIKSDARPYRHIHKRMDERKKRFRWPYTLFPHSHHLHIYRKCMDSKNIFIWYAFNSIKTFSSHIKHIVSFSISYWHLVRCQAGRRRTHTWHSLAVGAIFDFNELHIMLFIVVRKCDRITNDRSKGKRRKKSPGSVCSQTSL